VLALAGGVGWALVAADGSQIFSRQESLVNPPVKAGRGLEVEEVQGGDAKSKHLSEIPRDLTHKPFGIGLGYGGSAGGFGGQETVRIEEERVSAGSAYNLLAVELGAPGLLLWIGLTVSVLALGVTRLRRIVDPELRTYLVAVLATFVALTVEGTAGTTLAVTSAGVYLWFAPGVIAFWLAGPGRVAMRAGAGASTSAARAAPAIEGATV
jgi:hypothetical protein